MQGFLPAPLLRSLRRFTVPEEAEDTAYASLYSILTRGALLGTQRLVESSGDDVSVSQQVAVWGLLRLSSDDANGQSFERNLPGGISRIGIFVVVRGETSESEKELGTWQSIQMI